MAECGIIIQNISMEFKSKSIKLIIGLGNPEIKYQNTYHNVGRQFIKYIKENPRTACYQSFATDCSMNQSGLFVQKTLNYYHFNPENLLIVHDDSDITLGKYKFSFSRSSAGHKGINSVIQNLNTKNFWRLRIGIRPKEYRGKAEKFVLKKISAQNREVLKTTFQEIIKNELGIMNNE